MNIHFKKCIKSKLDKILTSTMQGFVNKLLKFIA